MIFRRQRRLGVVNNGSQSRREASVAPPVIVDLPKRKEAQRHHKSEPNSINWIPVGAPPKTSQPANGPRHHGAEPGGGKKRTHCFPTDALRTSDVSTKRAL